MPALSYPYEVAANCNAHPEWRLNSEFRANSGQSALDSRTKGVHSDIWGHWLIPGLVCHPTVGAGAPGRSGIAAPGLPLHDASQPIALTAGVTSAVERGGNAAHISDTVVIVRRRRSHRKLIGGAEGRSAPGSTCLPWSPGGSVREVFCCRDVCVVCNPLYRATVVNLAKIADAFTA